MLQNIMMVYKSHTLALSENGTELQNERFHPVCLGSGEESADSHRLL